MQRVFCRLIARSDHNATGMDVVELNIHPGPVKQVRSFPKVRRSAVFENELVRLCADLISVAHGDSSIYRSN